jgi:hypothetical protein
MSLSSAPASVNPPIAPAWSTTATPDWLFDEVAPDLAKAPLKVLLYIVRRTCGFRKRADAISLTQFQHGIITRDGRQLDKGCGVTNRTALLRALDDLEARGLIAHQDAIHADGGNATTIYYLLGPGQGGGAVSAPPPVAQDGRGGVPLAHPPGVPLAHPQQTDVPTNRKIERSLPPTPVVQIAEPRNGDEATRLAGGPGRDDTGAPTTPAQAQHRIDADYQALAGTIIALVERLGDGAPPWASVSRGYGLMTRAGLDLPAFLALLAEAELLMRPSLPHIEKPMAYLFRVVESLMQQGAPPRPRSTARPHSSDASLRRPFPAPQEPADAWGQVRAEIAREVTPENYARWFLPTRQLDQAGDVLTVAITGAETPAFHQQWLDRRLRGLIERCAARVWPGLQLAFVVEACAIPSGPVDGAR